MITAFCDRKGRIEFARGRSIPAGMMSIACGKSADVRKLISGTARLAYDNKTYLVPGIPEAKDDTAAYDALVGYCNWLRKRKDSGVTVY
jgi:hypothetical protein